MSTRLQIEQLRPWIEFRFSRSPGPGGQNVNKVNTRVTLFFDLIGCDVLSASQKSQIRAKMPTRITREGQIWIVRHKYRSQRQNREAAEQDLIELLAAALQTRKKRRPTRPTKRSQERRLDEKRRQGLLKKQRRSLPND